MLKGKGKETRLEEVMDGLLEDEAEEVLLEDVLHDVARRRTGMACLGTRD